MASTKLAFLAVAVLLLQASWSALSLYGGTAAVMEVTSFEGKDGGGPAACDNQFHSDGKPLAALSTQWYANGSRCFKQIRITSLQNAHSVLAEVIDDCDSQYGCSDDIVATSKAVWDALGLDTISGEVPIAWADAK